MPSLSTAGGRSLLDRGVWRAPWNAPNGEVALLAVTSTGQLLTGVPVTVPLGADPIAAADDLWDRLEAEDPPRVRPQLTLVR